MENAERCRLSRNNIMISTAVCFTAQAALLVALFETYFKPNSIAIMFVPVENIFLLLTKFICGLVLHLALFEEFSRALDLMKFALNHKDVFESSGAAWGVACM